jgi:hypothetical protein
MRKVAIASLLFLFFSAAHADWALIHEYTRGVNLNRYMDKATRQSNGQYVKIWELVNKRTLETMSDGTSYLSEILLNQYDCGGRRYRFLHIKSYSGRNGTGRLVGTIDSPNNSIWIPIHPNTIGEDLWRTVCY